MLSLIGSDSYTSFSQELLKGTSNIASLNTSFTISKYVNKLKQNKEVVSTTTNKHIPPKEFIKGFKKWKESTTTSPSGRHLGHHRSLLSSSGNKYNKDKENFSNRM